VISPDTAREWLTGDQPPTVVDVRTTAEFEAGHIPGSINVPLPLVEAHPDQLAAELPASTLLVCGIGRRAAAARDALAGAGAQGLHVLEGGITAHRQAGGETTSGRPRWAMERQVRLVAGSIVAGSILASLRFPRARFLAGGIGAGLTTAALTDSCAMGAALAKLPYNRPRSEVTLPDALAALDAAR
jgi:rhodanese-related sulfurtransferase